MNRMLRLPGDEDPFHSPIDAALAEVAVNLQLPPGLHSQVGDRYEAVRRYAERKGSPLHGLIVRFYPQGSMAIDATISMRGTDEEYDLDIVAELDLYVWADPDAVLDLLYEALKDYPVSQKVERQTRCVTIRYADGMHLDVTPSVRFASTPDRESQIFHANTDKPASEHYHVRMNAYGFAEWYRGRTPIELRFAEEFSRRFYDAHGLSMRADAEFDDVPDQTPLVVKNTATVALQLLKRHRNVAYANATGRIPPSIMLSCFAGHSAGGASTLSDMVVRQARITAEEIRRADDRGERVKVTNPALHTECFTDRWPENLAQQREYAGMLTRLANDLTWLKTAEIDQEDLAEWLRDRFGQRVVERSMRKLNDRRGRAIQAASQSYTPKGGIYVPSAPRLVGVGAAAAVSAPALARPHTFMGGRKR
jgi:hypothetical protein